VHKEALDYQSRGGRVHDNSEKGRKAEQQPTLSPIEDGDDNGTMFLQINPQHGEKYFVRK
jgi:hypothetical protein